MPLSWVFLLLVVLSFASADHDAHRSRFCRHPLFLDADLNGDGVIEATELKENWTRTARPTPAEAHTLLHRYLQPRHGHHHHWW